MFLPRSNSNSQLTRTCESTTTRKLKKNLAQKNLGIGIFFAYFLFSLSVFDLIHLIYRDGFFVVFFCFSQYFCHTSTVLSDIILCLFETFQIYAFVVAVVFIAFYSYLVFAILDSHFALFLFMRMSVCLVWSRTLWIPEFFAFFEHYRDRRIAIVKFVS